MKCNDVLGFLSPYLDSELDRDTTWRIAGHLQACPSCRERFEREARLERAIAERLKAAEGDESEVFDRVLARVLAGRSRRRRWMLPAVAACLALASLLAWGVLGSWPAREESARAGPLVAKLLDSALSDHREFVSGRIGPDGTWVQARAHLEEALGQPLPALASDSLWRIEGLRLCRLGTWKTAFVMGRRGDDPVSLFLLPPGSVPADLEREAARTPCFHLEEGLCGVLALRERWVTVAVGGCEMGMEVLETLASERL